MARDRREQASSFIDKVRKENGGLTRKQTEFLERHDPDILIAYNNQRRKLGASTKTCVVLLTTSSFFFLLV